MIQRIIFIGLLTAFVGGAAISKALDCGEQVSSIQQESQKRVISKAIIWKGEAVPAIELPEVSITAKRIESNYVEATLINGQLYPSYLISTVTIYPQH